MARQCGFHGDLVCGICLAVHFEVILRVLPWKRANRVQRVYKGCRPHGDYPSTFLTLCPGTAVPLCTGQAAAVCIIESTNVPYSSTQERLQVQYMGLCWHTQIPEHVTFILISEQLLQFDAQHDHLHWSTSEREMGWLYFACLKARFFLTWFVDRANPWATRKLMRFVVLVVHTMY